MLAGDNATDIGTMGCSLQKHNNIIVVVAPWHLQGVPKSDAVSHPHKWCSALTTVMYRLPENSDFICRFAVMSTLL